MFYHLPLTPSFSALFRPSGGGLTESIGGGTLKRSQAQFDLLILIVGFFLLSLSLFSHSLARFDLLILVAFIIVFFVWFLSCSQERVELLILVAFIAFLLAFGSCLACCFYTYSAYCLRADMNCEEHLATYIFITRLKSTVTRMSISIYTLII